jgi:hypothetical protein
VFGPVTGDSSYVVGVSAHRRYVFDHEERNSLPFSRSGMDAACSGRNTCAGLGEVMMVVLKGVKKRKRANYNLRRHKLELILVLITIHCRVVCTLRGWVHDILESFVK